jgi:iron complex outermembrane receptor protein
MDIPLVRRFDLNLSGRYDDYKSIGDTKNPKIAANWEVFRGLKLRANWAKSFVAPALTSTGADANGTTGETAVAAGPTNVAVPISAYPGLTSIPGISCNATTCTIGTAAVQGLQINGGNADLQPQRGKTWALGADINFDFIPELRISATYWHNQIKGGVTSPNAGTAVNIAGLQSLLTIFPAGATAAQLATITGGRPLSTTIPGRVSYVYDFRQRNSLNLTAEGIDAEIRYNHKVGANGIRAGASGSYKTKYDQQFGDGPTFSVLNSTGFNTTFPSVRFEGRAELGLDSELVSGTLFLNHTGSYTNLSGNSINPVVSTGGVPTSGGDRVKSQNTFDIHFDLRFPDEGLLPDESSLFVDVTNLFDKKPSFYNSTQGYDTFTGNPILRTITVGLRVRM